MLQLEVVLVWHCFIDVILLLEIAVTCCLVRLSFHLLKSVGEKGHKYWKQKRHQHHHHHHDYLLLLHSFCSHVLAFPPWIVGQMLQIWCGNIFQQIHHHFAMAPSSKSATRTVRFCLFEGPRLCKKHWLVYPRLTCGSIVCSITLDIHSRNSHAIVLRFVRHDSKRHHPTETLSCNPWLSNNEPKMSRKEKIIYRSLPSVCFLAVFGRWFNQLMVDWFFGLLISPPGRDFCLGVPDSNPPKKYPNHHLIITWFIFYLWILSDWKLIYIGGWSSNLSW